MRSVFELCLGDALRAPLDHVDQACRARFARQGREIDVDDAVLAALARVPTDVFVNPDGVHASEVLRAIDESAVVQRSQWRSRNPRTRPNTQRHEQHEMLAHGSLQRPQNSLVRE